MGTCKDRRLCDFFADNPDRYAVSGTVVGSISVTGNRTDRGIYCFRSEESVNQNTQINIKFLIPA